MPSCASLRLALSACTSSAAFIVPPIECAISTCPLRVQARGFFGPRRNRKDHQASFHSGRGFPHWARLAPDPRCAYALFMAQPDCAQCGGTGWKMVRSEEGETPARAAVRCDCSRSDRTMRLLERARIPRRYEPCDFSNFDTDLYEGEAEGARWDRSLEQAKLVVESFARDFPVGTDSGLLLMGPCGTGKTHLAVAALKQLVLRGHGGLFYDYRELLKEIQASYNPENPATELGVLEPVLEGEL